jgi:hypothetical protein
LLVGPLSLENIRNEKTFGLGSVLDILCPSCGHVNRVPTSKTLKSGTRGPDALEINARAVLGTIDAGMGHTHLEKLCCALDMPCLSHKAYKTKEEQVFTAVTNVAQSSCAEAMQMEVDACTSQGSQTDTDRLFPVAVGYDMQWLKRGRANNSIGGHATCIGNNTKKVVDFDVLNKMCRICDNAKSASKTPTKHICCKNHTGTSKSMEPSAAVSMWNRAPDQGVKYSTYIGDDDSATYKELRENVPYKIQKWSDVVHAKRNLLSKLYSIMETKFKGMSGVITRKEMNFIVTCFGYALQQNKNDPDGIRRNLEAIIPHCYGEHGNCPEGPKSWCGHSKGVKNYKHSTLNSDMTDATLRQELNSLLQVYCSEENLAKLAPLASTQNNENIHSIIGSKCPKIRFYSRGFSHKCRVAASVAQTNMGRHYVSACLEKMGIECGTLTTKYLTKQDNATKRRTRMIQTREFKRSRMCLKMNTVSKQSKMEESTAVQYQTGMGFDNPGYDVAFSDIVNSLRIPDTPTALSYVPGTAYNFLFLDFETNRLGRQAEICQFSCLHKDTGKVFNRFVMPNSPIDMYASRINGLTIIGRGTNRKMLQNGNLVTTVDVQQCLSEFMTFIRTVCKQSSTNIILSHNGHVFDIPVLVRNCRLIHTCTFWGQYGDVETSKAKTA